MAYQYITEYDSDNFTKASRGKGDIKFIVIHHWGAFGQKLESVVRYLCRKGGKSSAHSVIERKRVACVVDFKNIAWHAGKWKANVDSIGLECRPEASSEDFETVAEYIADIYEVYGVLPLRPHKNFRATACPGNWLKLLSKLEKRAKEILESRKDNPGPDRIPVKPKPAKKPKPKTKVYLEQGDKGNDVLRLQGYFNRHYPSYRWTVSVKRGKRIEMDKIFGPQTTSWTKEFQRRTGLKQTGVVDQPTYNELAKRGLRL